MCVEIAVLAILFDAKPFDRAAAAAAATDSWEGLLSRSRLIR